VKSIQIICLSLSLVFFCVGCSPTPESQHGVLAHYKDGQVTTADVEQRILQLNPQLRRPEDGDFGAWYETLVRELALNNILEQLAIEAATAEDPGFDQLAQHFRKQVIVRWFVEQNRPEQSPITSQLIEAYYDEHRSDFTRPARRLVYQIFKRTVPGQQTEVRSQTTALRSQVLAGESFMLLAAQHSDSETRHRSGLLGWVTPGQLSVELDRLIFSLDERRPSQVVETADGFHLFWVQTAMERKQFAFEDLRPAIGQILIQQRMVEALTALPEFDLPADSHLPDIDELRTILEEGTADHPVMHLGELDINKQQFEQMLERQAPTRNTEARLQLALRLIETLRLQEQIYMHCVAEGQDSSSEIEARLKRAHADELASFLLKRRLLQRIDADTVALESFFTENRKRYVSEPRFRLETLTVPLSASPTARMARLEAARVELQQGALEFQDIANQMGGETAELPLLSLAELRKEGPQLAHWAVDLATGGYSPPYLVDSGLQMLRMRERQEPLEQAFDEVRQLVREDYFRQHGQRLYQDFVSDLLEEQQFYIDHEQLKLMTAQHGT
jgi:hypothetical protein